MLFSKNKTIKERVVQALQDGPVRITKLIVALSPATKQAVYGALRELSKEEVVVVYKKHASLNRQWLMRMFDFSSIAHQRYFEPDIPVTHFKNIRPDQRLKFTFKTLLELDAFWCHVLYTLIENNPRHEPVFSSIPHWWFGYSRNVSESTLMDFCKRHGVLFLQTVYHNTPIDHKAKKLMDGMHAQYAIYEKPLVTEHSYYMNVLGEFIIDVWVDKKIQEQIERLYHKHDTITDAWLEKLEGLNLIKGKNLFVVSRNPKRAATLKKRLSRRFYIPKASLK